MKTYGPTDPNTQKHKHKNHEENNTRNKSNSLKPGMRTKAERKGHRPWDKGKKDGRLCAGNDESQETVGSIFKEGTPT